jgi:hypothetical protein
VDGKPKLKIEDFGKAEYVLNPNEHFVPRASRVAPDLTAYLQRMARILSDENAGRRHSRSGTEIAPHHSSASKKNRDDSHERGRVLPFKSSEHHQFR